MPYRDCKLTRILKESLSGNSHTVLLAALHPAAANYEECVSSLQFAHRCSSVQTAPRVNYVSSDNLVQQVRGSVECVPTSENTSGGVHLGGEDGCLPM